VIRGHVSHKRSRSKIEAAVGMAIWTSEADFEARRPMIEFFGHRDIAALSLRDLRAILQARGLPYRGVGSPEVARHILRLHFENETRNQEKSK
jgi:hypothetical protein